MLAAASPDASRLKKAASDSSFASIHHLEIIARENSQAQARKRLRVLLNVLFIDELIEVQPRLGPSSLHKHGTNKRFGGKHIKL